MKRKDQTEATARVSWLGVSMNLIASFLISVSLGMLAVLIPVTLENREYSSGAIGLLLSFDTAASIAICFVIVAFYKWFGMLGSMAASTLPRVGGLVVMILSDSPLVWGAGILVHGLGTYAFLLATQTWINAVPFKKNTGLWMAVFSVSMSVGIALGPVLLNILVAFREFTVETASQVALGPLQAVGFTGETLTLPQSLLVWTLLFHLAATLPIFLSANRTPKLEVGGSSAIWPVVAQCKGPMLAIAMAGVSYFSITSFITVYGIRNGLSVADAALLVTFFNLGSIILEIPLSSLSDRIDRRFVVVGCSLFCMVGAAYLPVAISNKFLAWGHVFVWGGVIGAIYSIALAMISERFQGEQLVAANNAYSIMEGLGGTAGVLLIGFTMDHLGSEGLPYVIMLASIFFFSFALTRYRVV